MTSNDINDLEKQIEDSVIECYCSCKNISPIAATGLVVGSALTTATVLSPTIRKITVPIAKFAIKQQFRLLAGLGVLSIATYITSSSSNSINEFE